MPGQEYEIVEIKVRSTRANGQPLVTKADKQFWAAEILTKELPETWITGLVFREDPTDWVGTMQRFDLTTHKVQVGADPDDVVDEVRFEHVPVKSKKSDRELEMIALLKSIDTKLEVLCDFMRHKAGETG